jgi:hypothetical protein
MRQGDDMAITTAIIGLGVMGRRMLGSVTAECRIVRLAPLSGCKYLESRKTGSTAVSQTQVYEGLPEMALNAQNMRLNLFLIQDFVNGAAWRQ